MNTEVTAQPFGAGALGTGDVAQGTAVGDIPARQISSSEGLAHQMHARTRALPWTGLIMRRAAAPSDGQFTKELLAARLRHFGGEEPKA